MNCNFSVNGLKRPAMSWSRHLALAGMGLLAIVCITLPPGMGAGWIAPAQADDHGGGDGGDDDGGGGGGVSSRNERSERKVIPANKIKQAAPVRKKAAPVRKKAAPAKTQSRPVLVVLDLPEQSLAEARRRGFSVLSDQRLAAVGVRVQRLRLPRRMAVSTARRILAGLGAAEADVNSLYRPQSDGDCGAGEDCPLPELAVWSSKAGTPCAASPLIGFVETSVDLKHAALVGQSVEIVDLRPAGTRVSGTSHGTAVAAIVAGARGSKFEGILPESRLIVAVPFYSSARGHDVAQAFDVVRAIDALLQRSPHVINLSLAGPANRVIERVLKQAAALGVPVVAAVGNAGSGAKPQYPAAYEQAVAVTAVSASLKIYRRAPRGAHIDFAAPGVSVPVAVAAGKIEARSGTSYAAPYVSAALAMLRQQNSLRPVAAMISELAASARDLGEPGKDRVYGWGLLQASSLCRDEG